MEIENSPFYVFDTQAEVEQAIQWLRRADFDVKKLSLIGKACYTKEYSVGFYTAGDQIEIWRQVAALWGCIWGQLLAPAIFFLPGIGLMATAGPIVTDLIVALDEAEIVGEGSALGAALSQIGASKEQAIQYETALKADKYILLVRGNVEELALARAVMATRTLWVA